MKCIGSAACTKYLVSCRRMYISVGSPVRASAAVPTFGINAVLGRASLEGTLSKMARWTAAEQRDQARGDPAGLSVRRCLSHLSGHVQMRTCVGAGEECLPRAARSWMNTGKSTSQLMLF